VKGGKRVNEGWSFPWWHKRDKYGYSCFATVLVEKWGREKYTWRMRGQSKKTSYMYKHQWWITFFNLALLFVLLFLV